MNNLVIYLVIEDKIIYSIFFRFAYSLLSYEYNTVPALMPILSIDIDIQMSKEISFPMIMFNMIIKVHNLSSNIKFEMNRCECITQKIFIYFGKFKGIRLK